MTSDHNGERRKRGRKKGERARRRPTARESYPAPASFVVFDRTTDSLVLDVRRGGATASWIEARILTRDHDGDVWSEAASVSASPPGVAHRRVAAGLPRLIRLQVRQNSGPWIDLGGDDRKEKA
jgi:hypothetical protein